MNRSWLIDRLGQASFSLVGVFNTVEEPGDEQHAYAVPASCFVYVRGGIGEFSFDGSYYEATRGSVFHMEADRRMTVSVLGSMPLEFYMILYSDASGETPSESEDSHSFLNAADVEGDVQVLEDMLHNWNKPGKIEQFRSKALFYTFLSRLLAYGEEDCQDREALQAVERTKEYMQQHYMKPISLQSLAELANLSVGYYATLFKSHVGMSPIDYLIRIRMQRAKQMLVTSRASLKDISHLVGYQDVYYFSRSFKKHFGLAPSRFSKREYEA